MVYTIMYGFTIGAILYFISVGLSLTFGTMRVINFAHTLIYTLGVYFLVTFMAALNGHFVLSGVLAVLCVVPVSYLIERFVIRKLYGQSVDYTFIATFAISLIGVDLIKRIWGVNPYPLSDPIGTYLTFYDFTFPVYRVLIIGVAIVLFFALEWFFRRSIIGKIVAASLDDEDGVLGGRPLRANQLHSALHGAFDPAAGVRGRDCRRHGKPAGNLRGRIRPGDGDVGDRPLLVPGSGGYGVHRHGGGTDIQAAGPLTREADHTPTGRFLFGAGSYRRGNAR
jgi:branched-subunit amino acid ABC-type transport system permease component